YCSTLRSLVSKAAAAFAEHSTDPQVLAAISDIETLTTGMSRKIWQKISLLHLDPGTLRHPDGGAARAARGLSADAPEARGEVLGDGVHVSAAPAGQQHA